ncbi:MAG: sodium:calcium antiporter [Deltaproteobacteria bacterium]|nr:sodium:calcium antiporter [Deltaproteobacteria bacterium]
MSAPAASSNGRVLAWLAFSLAMPLPWLLSAEGSLGHTAIAAWTGFAIIGAAFLLSWSVELGEQDLPQSFALLVLALVSVLPEYAVDLTFAIKAAEDPSYAHYAVANMTGANRLLIGLGWTSVVLMACWRAKTNSLQIPVHHHLEMRFLLYSTLYSFTIPLKGELNLIDAVVLLSLFIAYVVAATKGHHGDSELVGPAAWIDAHTNTFGRRAVATFLLFYAAFAIFRSAEPFAESLVELGHGLPIDEFLLVQWVAPLASESPEFLVALMFAWRMRGDLGIGALISSKVNQWTLLVGALPIAFMVASGGWSGLPLDARQSEELFLTSAQSLLATALIIDLDFSRLEAIVLTGLFGVQLVFPDAEVRLAFGVLYLVIFVGLIVHSRSRRQAFFALLRYRD